jgi:hypothetical protein
VQYLAPLQYTRLRPCLCYKRQPRVSIGSPSTLVGQDKPKCIPFTTQDSAEVCVWQGARHAHMPTWLKSSAEQLQSECVYCWLRCGLNTPCFDVHSHGFSSLAAAGAPLVSSLDTGCFVTGAFALDSSFKLTANSAEIRRRQQITTDCHRKRSLANQLPLSTIASQWPTSEVYGSTTNF